MQANLKIKRARLQVAFLTSKIFLGFLAAFLLAVCLFILKTQEVRSLSELNQNTIAIAQSYSSQVELKYNNMYWGIGKLANKEIYSDFKSTEKWSSEAPNS